MVRASDRRPLLWSDGGLPVADQLGRRSRAPASICVVADRVVVTIALMCCGVSITDRARGRALSIFVWGIMRRANRVRGIRATSTGMRAARTRVLFSSMKGRGWKREAVVIPGLRVKLVRRSSCVFFIALSRGILRVGRIRCPRVRVCHASLGLHSHR